PFRPPQLSSLFPYTTLFRSVLPLRTLVAALRSDDDGVRNIAVFHPELLALPALAPIPLPYSSIYRPTLFPANVSNIVRKDRAALDRKSTRLNSSHVKISYAV